MEVVGGRLVGGRGLGWMVGAGGERRWVLLYI